MNLGIEGKRALVTGGARGIGAAIVSALQNEGVRVDYTSRSSTLAFDPNVDILVNNAGGTLDITDPHCSPEDWSRVMDLNFMLAVRMSAAVIPYMKSQGWGRIVNITSIAGLENSGPITYCSAKAALTAYTHSMGRVLATESPGVVMSAIAPGVIKTEGGYWDKASEEHVSEYLRTRVPTNRFQTMAEIAPLVAFYCSAHASACHGAIISADQGQSRHYAAHTYL